MKEWIIKLYIGWAVDENRDENLLVIYPQAVYYIDDSADWWNQDKSRVIHTRRWQKYRDNVLISEREEKLKKELEKDLQILKRLKLKDV